MASTPFRVCLGLLLVLGSGSACRRTTAAAPPEPIRLVAGGPLASDFLESYQRTMPGIRLTLGDIRGSVAVVSALERGTADIGFAQADVVYTAYRKGLPDDAQPHERLRGIAVGESTNLYVVVRRDSPFEHISDLDRRRIAIAPIGSHAEVYDRMILGAYGFDERTTTFQPSTNEEMAKQLADGTIDAAIFGQVGIPEWMAYASRTVGIRVLDISGDVITKLRGRYPFFNRVILTAKELPGEAGEVQTLGVDNLLVCRQELSDERVYELTRGFLQASTAVDSERAAATPIPLHPGAARYYREREVLQ